MAVIGANSATIWHKLAPTWGFPRNYQRGSLAWAALAAGVVGYNLSAADGQMLSEQADRWIEKHPVLVRSLVALVAAHVANAAPSRVYPIHLIFTAARRVRSKL